MNEATSGRSAAQDLSGATYAEVRAATFGRSLKWAKFDPRNGNYDDCDAAVDLQRAEEFVNGSVPREAIVGWRKLSHDVTQFLVQGESDDPDDRQIWTVEVDYDGDCDGGEWRDCSTVRRVEVQRV